MFSRLVLLFCLRYCYCYCCSFTCRVFFCLFVCLCICCDVLIEQYYIYVYIYTVESGSYKISFLENYFSLQFKDFTLNELMMKSARPRNSEQKRKKRVVL